MQGRLSFLARRRSGFTLVEIMIVIAILGIVLGIALPTWIRQREVSQTRTCQENLSKIYGAIQQWALETNQPITAVPAWSDLVNASQTGFLKKQPACPAGGSYTLNAVNVDPTCSITTPDHNADPT